MLMQPPGRRVEHGLGVASRLAEARRGDASRGLVVVGIGAGASGFASVRSLLQALPANSGLSCVVVQHLDSEHPSNMV